MRKTTIQSMLIVLPLLLLILANFSFAATEKTPIKASPQEISQAAGLKAREEAIAAKERELARKEQELANLSRDAEEKYAKIIALQEELKAKLAIINRTRDQRFNNLIKILSAMSASKLAPLLDKMEDGEAVEILKAMKPAEVAKILPKLNQEKAVRISRSLGMM